MYTVYRVENNSAKRRFSWVWYTDSNLCHTCISRLHKLNSWIHFYLVFMKFIYVDFNYVKHLSPSHCACAYISIQHGTQFHILLKILASIRFAMWLRITVSCLLMKLSPFIFLSKNERRRVSNVCCLILLLEKKKKVAAGMRVDDGFSNIYPSIRYVDSILSISSSLSSQNKLNALLKSLFSLHPHVAPSLSAAECHQAYIFLCLCTERESSECIQSHFSGSFNLTAQLSTNWTTFFRKNQNKPLLEKWFRLSIGN